MTNEHKEISTVVKRMRQSITWKPSAATRHLLKRKLRGHLPSGATLTDYEALIQQVLGEDDASIYVYHVEESVYLTVATWLDGRLWLVMASFEGIMETAFVVENADTYLEREVFQYIGKMSEVMR